MSLTKPWGSSNVTPPVSCWRSPSQHGIPGEWIWGGSNVLSFYVEVFITEYLSILILFIGQTWKKTRFSVEVLNIYNFSIVVFMAHCWNSSRLGGSLQFQKRVFDCCHPPKELHQKPVKSVVGLSIFKLSIHFLGLKIVWNILQINSVSIVFKDHWLESSSAQRHLIQSFTTSELHFFAAIL